MQFHFVLVSRRLFCRLNLRDSREFRDGDIAKHVSVRGHGCCPLAITTWTAKREPSVLATLLSCYIGINLLNLNIRLVYSYSIITIIVHLVLCMCFSYPLCANILAISTSNHDPEQVQKTVIDSILTIEHFFN